MSEESLSSWIEWKEKCALDLCEEKTGIYLRDFIFPRFLKHAQTAGQGRYATPRSGEINPADAWHLFETYFQINETKDGKCYKDWLFDRIKKDHDPIPAIEGGATGLLRSAVREFLRREYAHSSMTSIQTPVAGGNLTLEDLLPGTIDPACEAELAEYRTLGKQGAAAFEAKLTEIEKTCILARFLNVSLADPAVVEFAGKRHTVLYETHKKCLQRLHETVHKKYLNEDSEGIEILTVSTLQALHVILFEQKKAEKEYADLFPVLEGEYSI